MVDGPTLVEKIATVKKAVAYVGPIDSDLYAQHTAAAKDPSVAEKFEFFHTTDETVFADLGLTASGIVVIRSFDTKLTTYSGDGTSANIVSFVSNLANPILINFSEEDIEPIF